MFVCVNQKARLFRVCGRCVWALCACLSLQFERNTRKENAQICDVLPRGRIARGGAAFLCALFTKGRGRVRVSQ